MIGRIAEDGETWLGVSQIIWRRLGRTEGLELGSLGMIGGRLGDLERISGR